MAEKKLLIEASKAEHFQHRGVRGAERVAALSEVLSAQLPGVFSVAKGEAIDFRDKRTGELDLYIFDKATASPIQASKESSLIPAEALYAVIEVKSVLTQEDLDTCMAAAKKVRALKPFKDEFIASRKNGEGNDNRCRCPYYVFAYTSNLGTSDWAQKEYDRIKLAAQKAQCDLDLIDQVIVLDRGIVQPHAGVAALKDTSAGIFLDFYIHLINFLTREKKRRPTIDWAAYVSRGKWTKLTDE